MLTVVQDQQPSQAGRVVAEDVTEPRSRPLAGAHRGRHGPGDQCRFRAGVQGGEPAGAGLAFGDRQRQRRLPRAAGPEQRQQAGPAELARHLRQLPLAADEAGQPDRQWRAGRIGRAVPARRGRHQHRAIGGIESKRVREHPTVNARGRVRLPCSSAEMASTLSPERSASACCDSPAVTRN